MKKIILFGLALYASISFSFAQTRTIQGTIKDTGGETLIGATVVADIKDGKTNIGTISDINGNFSLEIPQDVLTITVSYIGYKAKTIEVGNQTNFNIVLESSAQELGDIVVTALGIKKSEKALGYSFADVKGDELTAARDVNLINSISNKVAGVNISQTSGGAGTSSRVIIRGIKSISGNSQPLIVVDGVPIDNSSDGASWLGGVDYGNGLMDISPDDVETMSVLKGANASALYGSRAANGVILITTKKGSKREKMKVTINTNFMFDRAYVLGDYQNEYGAGFGGNMTRDEVSEEFYLDLSDEEKQFVEISIEVDTVLGTSDTAYYVRNYYGTGSWGPKFSDTITHYTWYGEFDDYKPQPDNVKEYFEKGFTATNTVAIESGSERNSWRFSFLDLRNKGLKPNSNYNRTSINYTMNSQVNDFLSLDFKTNYIRENAFNRVGQGDARTGARTFIWMPRSTDINALEEYYMDKNGNEQNWYFDDPWHTNPYWEAYKNYNNDNKDRFIGYVMGKIKATSWLSGYVRSSMDTYTSRRYSRVASNALRANGEGSYNEREVNLRMLNHDFLLTFEKSISEKWSFDGNLGGNYYRLYVDDQSTSITGLAVPDFFSLNNAKYPEETSVGTNIREKVIQSFYASVQMNYNKIWYLELTARNDWSSTLPLDNNSYFYPSLNTSFLFSDAFKINKNILPFGKLRFSIAGVGNDSEAPYQLQPTYTNEAFGEYATVYLGKDGKNPSLEPERTISWEIGTDLRFYNNRLGIDFTYYDASSYGQIVLADISKSTGYSSIIINGGTMQNKGVELLVNVTPIDQPNFRWDMTFNFAKNKNELLSLAKGIEQQRVTGESQVDIIAKPGLPYGAIIGTRIMRFQAIDSITGEAIDHPNNGKFLIDDSGLYVQDSVRGIIGNITPDWTGGVSTDITYKNFTLSASLGVSIGGDIFSKTNKYGSDNGQFKVTLEGRESWYAATDEEQLEGRKGLYNADGTPLLDENGDQMFDPNGSEPVGYVAEGVLADGTENTKGIDPQFYWHQHKWGGIAELDIFDASYVKLRDVTLNYKLPSHLFENNFIESASVSIIGKNLWLIYSGVPNIDPEASFTSNNNGLGQEYAAMPPVRSVGFNIKVVF